FIASFIGFFPADNPVILISVMIDNPRTTYWGGEVAAPTFKRILQRIVNMENQFEDKKQPEEDDTKTDVKMVTVPDFTNHRIDVGRKMAATLGLEVKMQNQGELIQAQQPAAGTKVPPNSEVKFTLVGFNKNHNGYRTTPKVIGLSVREAINRLTLANLHPVVKGSGIVVRQSPKPGERIKAGAKCVLECQPPINPENFALQ
ncbi:MAG: PASTA domain-containing protein, partial [candidate division KSB1 bacterium]|nr:PASTA domain-containing protein [candidate division KSB1 bacterium]